MEFRRLSDVELVEETTDNTNVLIEENGEIKKVSKLEIGTVIPTVTIKNGAYDECVDFLSTYEPDSYSLNKSETSNEISAQWSSDFFADMTYQEVLDILLSTKPVNVLVCDIYDDSPFVAPATITIAYDKTLWIVYSSTDGYQRQLFWNNEDRIGEPS